MSTIFKIDMDIFKQLMRLKLTNIRNKFVEKIVNIYIWSGCTLLVMGYLMQSSGLAKNFGTFQLASILAVIGLFELYGNTATLVSDFEGDRIIAYYLTIPSSVLTVLLSYICYYMIISISVSIALLPLGKLLLFNQLSLTNINWIKFVAFLFLVNLLWATFAFVMSAYLESIEKLGVIWCRVIVPMWFLGGFQFSWATTHSISPMLSYVILLNPVIYATEGMRSIVLGQNDTIPFWICCTVLSVMIVCISFWSYKALKKRLDFV